ncbi:double-strand break repair helicase AddA [Xinfangfangia sp. D13-10-4-6]|uniref:double-strand break repair helicase AddA n=1 Tax=Pseudogemmobacter hezensis TaxID=2737662 RepID=UPI0015524C50|nr:double-strand break repair helicase AddA [Pseudogemmobacter hezensis]NPD14272.1 double-strand break repair helicase AddA [Pseudogemmobacter hezensis]
MSTLHPASQAQIGAADPSVNVWLVANAGSGKTKVLTDRVARLLLRGTDPQNILCLTYTKAAAAEMQNRLFRRLGEWAMAPDTDLRRNLADLGEAATDTQLTSEAALRRARQLFARAIETPGGIRIQTIHSFCAGLLRRFPLEAGVSPSFSELDDRSAELLRNQILEDMAGDEARALFEAILPEVGERVDSLLARITGMRAELLAVPDQAVLREAFGLPAGLDEAGLLDEVFGPGDQAMLAAVVPVLQASSKVTDQKAGAALSGIKALDWNALPVLEAVFLFGATAKLPFGAKIDTFPTKDTRLALGAHIDGLNSLMSRVEAGRPLRLGLASFSKSMALHRFAAEFLRRYEGAKAAHGWLDFDDFITRATQLLTDPAVAPWVLYRLDGSIDHVLVDEAQDTSPAQWKIIAALTEEFMAGEGARDTERSLFVVGDKKQSIYSFQGADVAGFDAVKSRFAAGFAASGVPLTEQALEYSFRSSQAVLDLVDQSFPGEMEAALGGAFRHRPFHQALPGRVEIWPVVPKPEEPEPGEWFDPVDQIGEADATEVLARQIADEIGLMIREGRQIPDHRAKGGFRPVHAGDFLVLVQRRGPIFNAVIRACKAAGLPIAGPDRLTLTGELAVRDLLALLSFLNTPEDDLALATALRSPLFGWSEARLYALAHGRKGYLWEELRHRDEPETLAVLDDLRKLAEYMRPYDLLDRILTRHQGRARLLGRMGEEAADAIDELSQQALAYERGEVPSLTGFLVWMEAGEVEVKRQAEGEGRLIRVMTVHGSKGLEAPIVILPDTADRRLSDKDQILAIGPGLVTWSGRKSGDAGAVAEVKAQRAAAREAENLRLLYVALTRAKHWLIVAAAGEAGPGSWYGTVLAGAEVLKNEALKSGALEKQTAAEPAEAGPSTLADADGRIRLGFGDWPDDRPADRPGDAPQSGGQQAGGQQVGADALLLPTLPAAVPPRRLWSPSGLGGGEAVVTGGALHVVVDFDEDDPLERGTKLHLLLQHLADAPKDQWPELAARLGAGEALLQEAGAILTDPALAWLFTREGSRDSLAEAEIQGLWNGGWLAGSVDRLVITPSRITVVDFKSNALVPHEADTIPEPYLRQLGAYAHILAQIYPGRAVDCAILWTRAPKLMQVDPARVQAALQRAQAS